MRVRLALIFLGVMIAGVFLVAFGTQTRLVSQQLVQAPYGSVSSVQIGCDIHGASCVGPATTYVAESDFSLNFIGGLFAILGAIGFGVTYPLQRQASPTEQFAALP